MREMKRTPIPISWIPGKVLYHLEESRVGEDVSSNVVVRRLMDGESGMQRVTNTQGNDYLTGYASVAMNGWGSSCRRR